MILTEAQTPDDFAIVSRLCWDFRDFLLAVHPLTAKVVAQAYPKDDYARVLATLPQVHARPQGAIKIAWLDTQPVGCGMSHQISPGVSEIKRVFVSDVARGSGVGRAIMEQLIAERRAAGDSRIVLDTTITLTAAQRLYDSLGFKRRGPYQDKPQAILDHFVFFELPLDPIDTGRAS